MKMKTYQAAACLLLLGIFSTGCKAREDDERNLSDQSRKPCIREFKMYHAKTKRFVYVSMDRRILSRLDNYVKATKDEKEAGVFEAEEANGNDIYYIANIIKTKKMTEKKYIYVSDGSECKENLYILATSNGPKDEGNEEERKKFEFEVKKDGSSYTIKSRKQVKGASYYLGVSDCSVLIGNHHIIAQKDEMTDDLPQKFELKILSTKNGDGEDGDDSNRNTRSCEFLGGDMREDRYMKW